MQYSCCSRLPQMVTARNNRGQIPLQVALTYLYSKAAAVLAEASPAPLVLSVLVSTSNSLPFQYDCRHWLAVYAASFVRGHLPVTDQQWEQVAHLLRHASRPADLALPAALEHSPAQARQLVQLLPAEQQARLRTFGLCLARLQRRLRVPLPGPLAGRIMALFDA